MNIEDIITNAYEQFTKFANEVDSDFTQFPTNKPSNYRAQKFNELTSLKSVLNSLDIKNYVYEEYNSEEPDFLLNIGGERIGIEILSYHPNPSIIKDKKHWDNLCNRLSKDLATSLDTPLCFQIQLKNIASKGCTYDEFMTDFIRYYKEGRTHTKYIASIDTHQEKKTFACINQGPFYIYDIDIQDLYKYIKEKKYHKFRNYQQHIGTENIWLIGQIELSSNIDIENAAPGIIQESPYSKIFLTKGQTSRLIFSKQ